MVKSRDITNEEEEITYKELAKKLLKSGRT
jgi:hypothetical protein